MDWSFDWNRSRPETAGDWLVFYFVFPFVQFLFIGLTLGPAMTLKLFGAGMLLVLIIGEINAMLERRDSDDVQAINRRMRDARRVAAVVLLALLVAFAVQATAFPEVRLGGWQAFLILVTALGTLGVVNNRKRR